eukprot:2961000-Ditylum_brightwellii.AAC.1
MGFKSTRGDPGVYIHSQIKPDGFRYYEMILVYGDDILMISYDTNPIISQSTGSFRLKEDSLGPPSGYLGQQL